MNSKLIIRMEEEKIAKNNEKLKQLAGMFCHYIERLNLNPTDQNELKSLQLALQLQSEEISRMNLQEINDNDEEDIVLICV